jgi:acyl carrier protein
MNGTETWIVAYFEQHGRLNGREPWELLDESYFELELLDSLGVVQLIVGIEDDLGVRLESEQMQDPRFCSIRGLAQIVDEQRTNG